METVRILYMESNGNPEFCYFTDNAWDYAAPELQSSGKYKPLNGQGIASGFNEFVLFETDPILPDDQADIREFKLRWRKRSINGLSPFIVSPEGITDRPDWEEYIPESDVYEVIE